MTVTVLKKPAAEPVDRNGAVVPAPAPGKKPRRRRMLFGSVAAVALAAAGIYGAHWYAGWRYVESTNNAYLRADQVAMAPRVSGQVAEIFVSDNEQVAAGQKLVRIDARRYEMAAGQARATVEARTADVAKSEADLAQQDAIIAQAAADVDNAKATADLAAREFDRSAQLASRGYATQQKSEQTESALAQARSAGALKQAVLDAARRKVATLKAEVDQARAQLDAARQTLAQAEIDLADTVLRSPIAGRVGDRTMQLGQFVQPGTRLLTVVPTDRLYLVANFKETQIRNMHAGQPAEIRVDAYPDLPLTGTVESFSPGTGAQFALLPPENATGNFTKIVQRVPVRIRVDAAKISAPALVPGLSVEVSVDTKVHAPERKDHASGRKSASNG